MILQIALLILGTYIAIAFTLFFIFLKRNNSDVDSMRESMEERDKKLDRILIKLDILIYNQEKDVKGKK